MDKQDSETSVRQNTDLSKPDTFFFSITEQIESMRSHSFQEKIKLIPKSVCIVVGLVSAITLFIWIVLPDLKEFSAQSMKANSAVALLLLATALWFMKDDPEHSTPRKRTTGQLLAGLACVLAGLTLAEYLFALNLGIDELLVSDFSNQESALHPGRMSPISAFCAFLTGLSLVFLDHQPKRFKLLAATTCICLVFAICLQALIGYLYGEPRLYQIGSFIRISWQSASCFALLSIGILFCRPKDGPIHVLTSEGFGGMIARRFLPITILLPIFLGWLRLEAERRDHVTLTFGTAVLVASLVLVLTAVMIYIARQIDRLSREKNELIEALNERQNTLMAFIMNSPAALSLKDLQGRYVLANPNYDRLLEIPSASMVGKTDLEIFQKDVAQSIRQHDQEVIGCAERRSFEETIPTSAGVERIFSSHKFPIFDSRHRVQYVCSISLDITEKKRAEQTLAESEARFRQLADSMTQLAWVARPDGHVYWYNKRWYEYTGTNLEEMEGWGWQKVLHPDHLERVVNFVKEAWEKPEPFELTFPLRSAAGEWRWFLVRAVPLTNASGEIVEWFGTNTDVHEMTQLSNDFAAAVQARDEFLSIASHELKTPLTSLMLQAQIFKRKALRNDTSVYQKEQVDGIVNHTEKQSLRLNRLVDDMLDIGRIRSGMLVIEREECDLCNLVKEVLERLQSQFILSGASLPEIQICDAAVGDWDRFRLEQVVNNLLTNAIRYGEGKPVKIRVHSDSGRVTLCVTDQGIGIGKEDQEKIFDRFERAVNANEVSGLGLGLFITKQIVKAHGGTIWVESELGKGSTFFVELPRKKECPQSVEASDVL